MKQCFTRLLAVCLLLASGASALAYESPIPPDQRRGVEQTFLTYPEWFLVHSPAEYAAYVKSHPAHGFPFLGHVCQLWSSYASVTREQIRQHYPANVGYHLMIVVIASSTTMEYGLRSFYESVIGRISWGLSSRTLTDEDRYGARVAQDYVDFIRQEPWYKYDFAAKLKGLWTEVPWWGPDMLRKWERRYALTTEYLIKAAYGKLIGLGTTAAYDPALMNTEVVVDHAPKVLPPSVEAKVVRELPDGRAIMDLPRYFDFRIAATQLAQQGVKLVDIAGNTSVILVTLWAPSDATARAPSSRVLFEQPLLTMPGKKRVALILPVRELSFFLANVSRQGLTVEHVYDY